MTKNYSATLLLLFFFLGRTFAQTISPYIDECEWEAFTPTIYIDNQDLTNYFDYILDPGEFYMTGHINDDLSMIFNFTGASNEMSQGKYRMTGKLGIDTNFLIIVCGSTFAKDLKPRLNKVSAKESNVELSWTKVDSFKGKYRIYRSTNGKIFMKVGEVSKIDTTFVDRTIDTPGLYYYQIMASRIDTFFVSDTKEIQVDIDYSNEKNLKSGSISTIENSETDITGQSGLNVYPTVFCSDLNVSLDGNINQLKLFDMSGRELYTENVKRKKGVHTIQLEHLSKGTYILNADNESFKVIKE